MGNEHVKTEEEDEHGGPIFQVPVQLPDNTAEPEESNYFQSTEEAPDPLKSKKFHCYL